MREKIYFSTLDGDLISNHELSEMAYIIHGEFINSNDFDAIREYAKKCKGIVKEIEHPSIEKCIQNGHKYKAIMIYRERHPGIGLKEAKDIIDNIAAKLNNKEG